MIQPIYLDYNATTPVDPRVAEAMLPYLYQHFGNPSSAHVYGRVAHEAVERARQQVATMLGCRPAEVLFTSGGTEANNTALRGVAMAHRHRGNHIITSNIEHPAISEVCGWLATQGFRITALPVDAEGLLDPAQVADAITADTILVTVMHANNEVGTLQPIAAIAAIAHQHGALVHSDCAQSAGKVPVRVDDLGVDLLTLAGHKLYAPKGVGALYIREGTVLEKLMWGANHEANRRAGTENVMSIVGLGKACALVHNELDDESEKLRRLRDRLEEGLLKGRPDLRINGSRDHRLPNTSSLSVPGLQAQDLLDQLSDHIAASAGAACHSDGVTISHVLEAMQVPPTYAAGTLRLSVGRHTNVGDLEHAITAILKALHTLQPNAPLPQP